MFQVTQEQLRKARIPKKFWILQPQGYKGPPSTISQVLLYIESLRQSRQWLVLHGKSRTYKTFLATLVLRIALAAGFKGAYMSFQDEYATFFDSEEKARRRIRRWLTTDVLVIDNVNAADNKGLTSVLPRLIRPRSDNDLKTIIVTTLSPEEFYANYGDIWETIESEALLVNTFTTAPRVKVFKVTEGEKVVI